MADADSEPAHRGVPPSAWVARFARLVPTGGTVLDLACGSGRHGRLFLGLGYRVVAVDRDISGVADLAETPGFEADAADLEDGGPWRFAGRAFDGIVATNYLHRPLLPHLVGSLAPGGVLIYETFAQGNERFGRPRNPAFLLAPGELLEAVRGRLQVVAYEHGVVDRPRPAAVQRLVATAGEAPLAITSL